MTKFLVDLCYFWVKIWSQFSGWTEKSKSEAILKQATLSFCRLLNSKKLGSSTEGRYSLLLPNPKNCGRLVTSSFGRLWSFLRNHVKGLSHSKPRPLFSSDSVALATLWPLQNAKNKAELTTIYLKNIFKESIFKVYNTRNPVL